LVFIDEGRLVWGLGRDGEEVGYLLKGEQGRRQRIGSRELTLGRILCERKLICLSAPPIPAADAMAPGWGCLSSMGRR
jgi:hypothetical protein